MPAPVSILIAASAQGSFLNPFSKLEVKDWLGIAAFFISVWNLLVARWKERREPLRTDICKAIDDLITAVTSLSDEIEKHLCGESAAKAKEDIYRAERRTRELQEAASKKFPVRKAEIFRAYADWWKVATDDGFPVQSARGKFNRNSARVLGVSMARAEMVSSLQDIRLSCLTGSVSYWKR